MKRLISLLLVIVLVVGLVPTAFADDAATPDVALTLETPKPKTVTVSGESVTYYEIPVKVKNNTSEKITLNAFECYLKFDATGFTPVELMADDGTLIMSASFGSPVSNWSSKTTEKKNDLVLATGAEGKLAVVFLNVPANGATELFKLNLKPVDGIEKGDYPVRLAKKRPHFRPKHREIRLHMTAARLERPFMLQVKTSLIALQRLRSPSPMVLPPRWRPSA